MAVSPRDRMHSVALLAQSGRECNAYLALDVGVFRPMARR